MLKVIEHEPLFVAIWPDGDYVVLDELFHYEYAHKSDDYTLLDLNDFYACQEYPDQGQMQNIIDEVFGYVHQ